MEVLAAAVPVERAPANERRARSPQFDTVAGHHVRDVVLPANGVDVHARLSKVAASSYNPQVHDDLSSGSTGVDALQEFWWQREHETRRPPRLDTARVSIRRELTRAAIHEI